MGWIEWRVTSRVELFHDMSSSASDPLPGIPQELKELFSWNPPSLNPLPFSGGKMSTIGTLDQSLSFSA